MIFDLLTMKSHINKSKELAQFISVYTSASSALLFLNGLSSILSQKLDIDINNNQKFLVLRKSISSHMIVKPKYENTWNVGISFGYWKEKIEF